MAETVIEVKNLSKRYRIGLAEERHETLAQQLVHMLLSPIRNFKNLKSLSKFDDKDDESVFWALKDINFEVKKGEVLGIIGHNGAGKSTLLKILSRITEPTEGEIKIKGRVSSLLEVGTGFHADLSGRENVYMNGTILGMTRKEIDRKFKEIHEFSGIGKYIDTPVKRYSSGMKVRLAFSVAAHLDPEILIIDEVLAVGDAEFQKKCLGKMEDVAGQGRTVLFVSHNMAAVQSLCSRCLLLGNGKILEEGNVELVIEKYLDYNSFEDDSVNKNSNVLFDSITIENLNGDNSIKCGDDVKIIIKLKSNAEFLESDVLEVALHFYDALGKRMFVCSPTYYGFKYQNLKIRKSIICKLPNFPLSEGRYSISIWYSLNNETNPDIENAFVFDVGAGDFYGSGKLPKKDKGSLVLVKHEWN